MLRAGDRVLVCLSGGKDSLSLLHVLRQYRFVAASRGEKFELAAVTVDPQSSQYDPRPLIPYLRKLGVNYYYEVQGEVGIMCLIMSRAQRELLLNQGINLAMSWGRAFENLMPAKLFIRFPSGLEME